MEVTKGGSVMIFVTIGGVKKAIAMATSHTFEVSMETKETTSKDTGGVWSTAEPGTQSWAATSENLVSADTENPGATYDDLVDLMLSREPVEVVFGPRAESVDVVPSAGWTPKAEACRKGMALITGISQNAPGQDNATFTVNFTGVGPLEKLTTTA